MKKAKYRTEESFSIIVSSGSDARKRPFMFNIQKKTAVMLFCAALVFVAAILAVSIILLVKSSENAGEINALEQKLYEQNTLVETYSKNLQNLQQSAQQNKEP